MKNVMMKIKVFLKLVWGLESQFDFFLKGSRFLYYRVPIVGKVLSFLVDRICLVLYGVEMYGYTVNVKELHMSHPTGVLLGGNGIVSDGRVVIMSGVKFGGRSPKDPEYILRHKTKSVFLLGDNVVIASNTVLIGPLDICDNVVIGAMSLVNKSITEPGVYVGVPVKKVSDDISYDWLD